MKKHPPAGGCFFIISCVVNRYCGKAIALSHFNHFASPFVPATVLKALATVPVNVNPLSDEVNPLSDEVNPSSDEVDSATVAVTPLPVEVTSATLS